MMKFIKCSVLTLLALFVFTALALTFWEPIWVKSAEAPAARSYDVEIIRDEFGVPHIKGRTDVDTAYGIAWAHSEDDFATLQEVAAMTRMRLGAMTGEAGAQVDYVGHLLDIQGVVEQRYDTLPADVRALLDGYAAGMNRYAETHSEEVRLPGLFPLNGRDIAAGFYLRSPFFYGLNRVLEPLVSGEELKPEGGPSLAFSTRMTPIGRFPEHNGSNAFAVAPARSGDNVTRLVSNSHQPWEGPVAWYELVVHSDEGWDFAGATFPGSPFPFLGHNRYLGWTNTVNRPDLIDVYRLEVDAAGENYQLDGKWQPLIQKRVWLRVKWGPFTIPYPQTVYRSAHGPVVKNPSGYFAIRYASIGNLDQLTQYYRIQKARNFGEWQAAMQMQGVPATNFVYADKDGNIALFYNARFPDRQAGANWRTVLPGDRSDLIWKEPVDWSQVPKLINPDSGYVMNANNTPYQAAGPGDELQRSDFSPLLGIEENWTNRGEQAIALFEAVSGPLNRAALERIKYDKSYSRTHYPRLWMEKLLAVGPADDDRLIEAQRLLRGWDWRMDGKGEGDALAAMLMNVGLFNAPLGLSLSDDLDARVELSKAADHLMQHFGTLDPPLGDLVRLRKGKTDLPYLGGSDALRAATRWRVEDDGRLAIVHGDSFLMFVEWDAAGNVSSQSIQPFGSATTRPDSPHYTDQAPLFVAEKLKPVHFEWSMAQQQAKRRYRPE